jgi:DNA repair protein RadC
MSKKPKKDNPNKSSINKGHRKRMRQRYIKSGGLETFAEHEIVEMLLYYTIPRRDTNKIAHEVVKEFGNSLHNLFEASPKQIMSRTGLSEASAVILSMIPHLAQKYQYSKWERRVVFSNSAQLGNYAKIPFIGQSVECFYMLCLDSRMALRGVELLERGTLDWVELYPRKIVDYALINKSTYVVLAHNHPSGCRIISRADVDATVSIMGQLAPFNIYVLDHIIVAGEEYISFAERGILGLKGVNNPA